MDANLSQEEMDKVVELLSKFSPGFLPYPIFAEIARLVALPIIEFIPLRLSANNKVEVLLLSRANDDPIWPGMLHTPGTVIRATDKEGEMYKAYERILKDELDGTLTGEPYYVGSMFHESKRGMEQAQLFWVEVSGEPRVGQFFDSENLPENLIESQTPFIKQATKSFKSVKLTN